MLDLGFIQENWLYIAGGLGQTLLLCILSTLPAIPIAFIIGYGRSSTVTPISAICNLYTSLIDATPLILQIMFVFLAFPQMRLVIPGLLAGTLILFINSSARFSEAFRIWFSQEERERLKPEKFWTSAISNEFINLLKDSALISIAGFVHEITWRALKTGRATFHSLEAILIAVLIYWFIVLIISIPKMIFNAAAKHTIS